MAKNKLIESTKIDIDNVEKQAKKLSDESETGKIEKQAKINITLPKSLHMKLKMYTMINDTNIQEVGLKLFQEFLNEQDLSNNKYF